MTSTRKKDKESDKESFGSTEEDPKVILFESKKENLFKILQSIYDLGLQVSVNSSVKSQFLSRISSLDQIRTNFMETLDAYNLALLESGSTTKPNYAPLTAFDEIYCQIKGIESNIRSQNKTNDNASNKFEFLNRKLPPLKLVSFDGTPSKWITFHENFKSLIHDNSHLTDAEKVQYLIGCLSGKALTVCSGIVPTANNYLLIWNALIEKYQDTRVQASMYLHQMLQFKPYQSIDIFLEQFHSAQAALRRLNIKDLSDFIITDLALSKLDKEVVNLFEQSHSHIAIPTFDHLSQFLKEQSKIITLRNHSFTAKRNNNTETNKSSYKSKNSQAFASTSTTTQDTPVRSCKVCGSPDFHPLYRCSQFINQNAKDRSDIVNKYNFCRNCLGFHNIKLCKSTNTCSICHRKHHSLLHLNNFNSSNNRVVEHGSAQSTQRAPAPAPPPPSTALATHGSSPVPAAAAGDSDNFARENSNAPYLLLTSATSCVENNTTVLLPTASVYAYNNNKPYTLRVFLDTGSMSHFITKACCKRLNLEINPDKSSIFGIGHAKILSFGTTTFKIFSRFDQRCCYTIHAWVLDRITDDLPNVSIDITNLAPLRNLPMADDAFHIPGEIDCLLGNELFPLLLGSGKVPLPGSSVVAVETTLGYIAMGRADCQPRITSRACPAQLNKNKSEQTFLCATSALSLDTLTQRFWELESVPNKNHMSPDDQACEQIFNSTHSRDETGRYTVQLPFKAPCTELGNSYSTAMRRLINLEKKLDSDPDIRANYNATLQDYIDKGYLDKVKDPSFNIPHYYIPHRAVYRPDKQSSKTRIVLDASCKTSSGKSLNDLLYIGPNLQSNIFNLLINLRMFSVAVIADIEKMYFQLNLSADHHAFQRILYRFNKDSDISTFEFNRVSFGVSSSPYLAMRVVRQLASDSRDKYPLAAYEAENHMYMDDYVCSLDGVDIAEQTYQEMVAMFRSGGFNLVKWISNSSELLNKIPSTYLNPQNIEFDADAHTNTKIVGMQWNPIEDFFQFKINGNSVKCTKRTVLSATARLFDPLGLIGPVVAYMKVLVQECWKHDLDWDDAVPAYIENKFNKFHKELSYLEQIKFPRHVGIIADSHVTLLGFADASERCYGAAVYIRVSSNDDDNGSVFLLTSKSRVAPLKNTPLARLELCAALLLANLLSSVVEVLSKRCKINNVFAFSDSTVTLTWIHSPSHKFHTFVANRIVEINSKLPAKHWFHIDGTENPADVVSRPVTPKQLLDLTFWFTAPHWFSFPLNQWPIKPFKVNLNNNNSEVMENKNSSLPVKVTQEVPQPIQSLIDRISKYSILLRSLVLILRFCKLLNSRGCITVSDLDAAEIYLIRYVQSRYFAEEINALKSNKTLNKSLAKLNPFLDSNNILRVGGRLTHSQLDYGQKHPILIPTKSRFTQILIDFYHVTNLHTGPALLLSIIRQKFWILSARNIVRQRVHSCNKCFKLKPQNTYPPMGDLPDFRVSQAKAFVNTAVDYCGPFYITHIRKRGIKSHKAYICVFVCLTTKAVHLELVSDLSSDLFLAAFKRFISRRGPVAMIYSDGGTNFIGAKRKLNEIYALIQSKSHINYIGEQLAQHRVRFKHSPPYGPHFNGLSEVNVRCVKTHLFKVIGSQILTYEEFSTILVQIECLLNNRPLSILSSDPSDISALTPNHFLNVTPLKFLPAEDVTDISDNRLSRYQLLNKITHSFWRRWSQEYLTSLQQREKWNTPSKPIEIGTIVVIKDNNAHPLCWPLGIIDATYPGKDNIVRTVKVRTASGSYIRPVVRLCPLPTQ